MEKKNLIEAGKRLTQKGLVVRSWGNLSLRQGQEKMYITPSGISYENIREDDIVSGDIYGRAFSGGDPSSEHLMHEKIYQADEGVKAIVHTHQPLASALGATDIEELPDIDLAFVPYCQAGSQELAEGAAEAAKQSDIIILRHHGCLLLGRGQDDKSALDDAIAKAERLEQAARKVIEEAGFGPLIEKQSFLPPDLKLSDLDMILDRIFYWNKAPIIEALIEKDLVQLFARTDDFAQIGGVFLFVDPERGVGNSGRNIRDIEAAAAITCKNALAFLLSEKFGGHVIDEEEAKRLRQNYIDIYSKKDRQAD